MNDSSVQASTEDALIKRIHYLEKKVKELDCLSDISRVTEKNIPLVDLFQEILEIIPSGWNYPEIVCARISFEDWVFQTDNFRVTQWKQSSNINVHGKIFGNLEIFYLDEVPEADEGPFLNGERELIDKIAGILGKVSERKLSEDTLHSILSKERTLDTIYKSSPVVAFLWKAEDKWPVEFVSDNIDQFGYSVEDFTSGSLFYIDMVHPDDREYLKYEVSEYDKKGSDYFSLEYRILTKNGNVRWITERSLIKRAENNNITHYHGIIFDITDRRLAEDSLKASEEKYSSLVEKGNDGIIIVQDGLLKFLNSRIFEMLGYDRKELFERPFLNFIPPEDRDITVERYF